jgi:alkyl hydroperoxide reductase subunit AhpF
MTPDKAQSAAIAAAEKIADLINTEVFAGRIITTSHIAAIITAAMQERERELVGCLKEMVDAMHRYEMDVDDGDTAVPLRHRNMMQKAEKLLATHKEVDDGGNH